MEFAHLLALEKTSINLCTQKSIKTKRSTTKAFLISYDLFAEWSHIG